MTKIGICGHFGFGKKLVNGQTIKSLMVMEELQKKYGMQSIILLDTSNGIRDLFNIFKECFRIMKNCSDVILMLSDNGTKVIVPYIIELNKIFNKKLHFVVIGGRFDSYLIKNKFLIKKFRKFKGIYVETENMKYKLNKLNFNNIYIVPNCKNLNILDKPVFTDVSKIIKICIFSRVMKEKGIELAIDAITKFNKDKNKEIFKLDIFGPIDKLYKDRFELLQKNFPSYITYKGCVDSKDSTDILKNYYALLFPTYYKGEGFAGSLIDAFAAGVPIVASDWKYNREIVTPDVGFLFDLNDKSGLKSCLEKIANEEKILESMRYKCLIKANNYIPANALKELFHKIT